MEALHFISSMRNVKKLHCKVQSILFGAYTIKHQINMIHDINTSAILNPLKYSSYKHLCTTIQLLGEDHGDLTHWNLDIYPNGEIHTIIL